MHPCCIFIRCPCVRLIAVSGSLATQWLRHQTNCQTVSMNEEDLRHVKVEEESHFE
jgi:hypothetical protein